MKDQLRWDKLYLDIAKRYSEETSCLRRKVGAVITVDNRMIAAGYNGAPAGVKSCKELGYCMRENAKSGENLQNCLASHAEMNAIREASKHLGETLGWRRLTGCDMYVTMEPCSMCAGALVWSRIENLYIGVRDPKAGGCGSVLNIIQEEKFNHHVNLIEIDDGPLKDECRDIIQGFFRDLRDKQKKAKLEETEK